MTVPYADEVVDSKGRVFAVCPMCKRRIQLHFRKDFESYFHTEYLVHVEKEHPKQVKGW